MVEFETLESKDIRFGNNNFIEVSIKMAKTDEGENTFFSLSRGFFTPEDEKRYKKNFAIPNDGNTLEEVINALKAVADAAPASQAPEEVEPTEEETGASDEANEEETEEE